MCCQPRTALTWLRYLETVGNRRISGQGFGLNEVAARGMLLCDEKIVKEQKRT